MVRPTTPPGFGSGFDPDAFREAIRATMTMGLPETVSERATFRWKTERTYDVEDQKHNPYSWDDTPATELAYDDVRVPVAVEFSSGYGVAGGTTIGQFDATRVVITVLDVDYALIEGADLVLLGGNTYNIDYIAPPVGLFEVTVYMIHATAQDES